MKKLMYRKQYNFQIFKGFAPKLQLTEALTDKNLGPRRLLSKSNKLCPPKFTHMWLTHFVKMPTTSIYPPEFVKTRFVISVLVDICMTAPFFVLSIKKLEDIKNAGFKIKQYIDVSCINIKNRFFNLESTLDEEEDSINKVISFDEKKLKPIYYDFRNIQCIHSKTPQKVSFSYFKTFEEKQRYILLGEFDYYSVKYNKKVYRNFVIQLCEKSLDFNDVELYRQKETISRRGYLIGDYESKLGFYTENKESVKVLYDDEYFYEE